MWILYQLAVGIGLLVAGPFLLARRGRHYLASLPVRLGRIAGGGERRPLWIHAVSVGEVGVAATLARALPAGEKLLVTTVTPTGQERALAAFAGRATVTYLPFDLGFAVNRFFEAFRPRALILVEGDLWPLVLRRAKQLELPIRVVNARVSDASFRRMRRLQPLLGPLFDRVDRFGVQSEEDSRRLRALGVGADRIELTGNLKFETPEPEPRPEVETRVRRLAAERPVLIAGSTMRGEETLVLDAFERLGAGGRALLVLAPRHPERWDEAAALVSARQLVLARRSTPAATDRPDVLLLDSLGELAALYRLAAAAFIGGTLVPSGGHNPLEAARWGIPVAVGPSMENFRAIAEAFDRGRAWQRVVDPAALADCWRGWLDSPASAAEIGARGAALLSGQRGALDRTVEFLRPLLKPAEGAG